MKPSVRASSVDGLRRELKDLRRSVMDLHREQSWRFDSETTEEASGIGGQNGTDTISDTQATAIVAHGVGAVPESVVVTAHAVTTLGVTNRDATTFTVERAGTTGDLNFDWVAFGGVAPAAGAYEQMVLDDGATLLLPLGDASGTTAAALVGADGSYVGSPTLQTAGPSVAIPYAIATDGVDDYVAVGALSPAYLTAQSWEWWAYTSSGISASGPSFVAMSQNTGTRWVGYGNQTGALTGEVVSVLNYNTSSGDVTAWSGFTIPAGWHHYVLTYNGTQNGWTLYIDGVATGTKISVSGGSYGWEAGTYQLSRISSGPTHYAIEGLAMFAVYEGIELTATQVADHYAAGS